jgi:hypothetical protein
MKKRAALLCSLSSVKISGTVARKFFFYYTKIFEKVQGEPGGTFLPILPKDAEERSTGP